MKVGILIWDLAIPGGSQRQAVELARQMIRGGIQAVIYAIYFDADACSSLVGGIPVQYLYRGDRQLIWKDPKILGLSVYGAPFLYREWRVARMIPDWIGNDIDLLNAHDNMVFTGAYYWKRRTGKPVLWMMNDFPGVLLPSAFFPYTSWNAFFDLLNGKRAAQLWYKRAISRIDKIVVLDHRNQGLLLDHAHINPVVIRSGLDLLRFSDLSRETHMRGQRVKVLSSGIFLPHRRLEDLTDALVILSNMGVEFIWRHVGTEVRHPEYAAFIKRRVEKAGIADRCEFLGKVSEDELVGLYRDSDVFVFPNSPQTWGLAVFEAMACRTPVIVSRGAGASEVLTDGVNSLLVDPCKPDQIAGAIQRIASSSDLWAQLSDTGRKFVEANFCWDIYARNMRVEMEMLCAGGRK